MNPNLRDEAILQFLAENYQIMENGRTYLEGDRDASEFEPNDE